MPGIVVVAKGLDANGAALYALVAATQCAQAQASSSWSTPPELHEEHRAQLVACESGWDEAVVCLTREGAQEHACTPESAGLPSAFSRRSLGPC